MGSATDQWYQQIDKKIDRLLNDVEFIKNRTSMYLGGNEGLTYLIDETPILVNTDDLGCPLNFLNGGLYEEDYFRVLLSYRRADSVFLDIGANLGVYTLRLASVLRAGLVHAFEPLPRIRNLFSRSVYLNGLTARVVIHPFALSDQDGEASISVPLGHTGGASLEAVDTTQGEVVQLRRLDELVGEDFRCDLIKIDVEGHEMHALAGARRVLERSSSAVVMFEKLALNSGIESDLMDYGRSLGWQIYLIDGVHLRMVDLDLFENASGYFMAGRPDIVESGGLQRNFFGIDVADLNVISGEIRDGLLYARATGIRGSVVFHGPYWFLPRGYYRVELEGEISGQFELELTERFGYKVHSVIASGSMPTFEFVVYRDLTKFEFVLRTTDTSSTIEMRRLRVARLA